MNEVIDRMKKGLSAVPEVNAVGNRLLFYLSPNDLVYVPDEKDCNNVSNISVDNIYKIVSFTNKRLYGIPCNVSKAIIDKIEYTQLNKIEFIAQKNTCIPLKVDRLGNVMYVGAEFLPKRK